MAKGKGAVVFAVVDRVRAAVYLLKTTNVTSVACPGNQASVALVALDGVVFPSTPFHSEVRPVVGRQVGNVFMIAASAVCTILHPLWTRHPGRKIFPVLSLLLLLRGAR